MKRNSEIRNSKSEGAASERGQPCPRVSRALCDLADKTVRAPSEFGFRISDFGVALLGIAMLLHFASNSRAAFVYETATEFLTSGHFNNDTNADVLVLDKATGIGRVGYQDQTGALTWSAPLVTGVENVTGCAIGRFLESEFDHLAVTSTDYNRVPLIDLSNTNSASTAFIVTPSGIGPHTLAGLAQPIVPPLTSFDTLLVASAFNSPSAEQLELTVFSPGPITSPAGPFNENGLFERGNALQLSTDGPTFATGIVRGDTSDSLHLWQFTNSPGVIATLSNLPPGSDYVFGKFDGQALPHFWFYLPGQSNVTIRPLISSEGGYGFGAAIALNFTQAVQNIYYVAQGDDGSAFIRFGDGIQGARLPGGSPQLAAKYANGGGASGNVFTGITELDNGTFALFSAPTGTVSSLYAQVMTFDGTNYTQISSNSLPAVSTSNNRATVWLFQSEPFINTAATLISSISVPDWSSGVTGLPGSLSVRAENDSGAASGLGSPATNNLGAPPAGTTYALSDQYRDDISFFSYAPTRPAEPIIITISPPPGSYGGSIQISFTKQNASHQVFYRVGVQDSWKLYSTPFPLTNDATIQYYGNIPNNTRGRLQFADYALGRTNSPGSLPVKLPGSDTNTPPDLNTNFLQLSANGTVFYNRRSALADTLGFLGPTPYLSIANSPFNPAGLDYFYLEDFEDNAFNTPGATPSAGWIIATTAGGADSVDPGGRSYYSGGTQTNLTVTFNAAALGGKLPTHAGVVWTDVGNVTSGSFGRGNVRFTARDANGVSLGTIVGVNLGDGSPVASQAEDRFFGVVYPGGISSISIAMTNSTDWEIDHVQYGRLSDAGFRGSIEAINLDGSGETHITTGSRPRVSRDRKLMSFLREHDPAPYQYSLWVRNLATGEENRLYSSSNRFVGQDWRLDNSSLIFDNNCFFWNIGLSGPPTQLPLSSDCRQGAPAINPADGRVAFQVIYPSSTGLYLAPADVSARQRVNLNILSPRWPAWSPSGKSIAIADDPNISPSVDAGHNLWVVNFGAQTNVSKITDFTDNTNGFPHGAIWAPNSTALVGAGRIGGTNGLWVIPLAPDGSSCQCPPRRLPTSAGDAIDFAGSIIVAPPAQIGVQTGLFVRQDADAVVVYWSTDFEGYTLESQDTLSDSGAWTPIPGPYFTFGGYYEYREAKADIADGKFFRLHLTVNTVLRAAQPGLLFRVGASESVLSWPVGYSNYTLEVTTNLTPPVKWRPLNAALQTTNATFEYRRNLPDSQQEFYRLRGP